MLLALTGGPGQGGVAFVPRARQRMRRLLRDYRLVMLDQRGTGAGALRCPALQRAMGDLRPHRAAARHRRGLRTALGPRRRFYTTADTVADLDALRAALGARRCTLDGVSYGTFVAERYAIAHPDRVARLVLDSVVPAAGIDPFQVDGMHAVAARAAARPAARSTAGATRPPTSPPSSARATTGRSCYDTLVAMSVGDPRFHRAVPRALRDARPGRRHARAARARRCAAPSARRRGSQPGPARRDPVRGPARALGPVRPRRWPAARRRCGAPPPGTDPAPYDRATVIGNGFAQTCLRWPPTPAPAPPRSGDLPPVPTLLLAGDHDLSTPLPWAREQAAHTPQGRLIVVRGAGHSVQSRSPGAAGRRAVERFLLG